MKCPECKKTMKWQEGLLDGSGARDMEVGKYYCPTCHVFSMPQESRGIRKGRKLAHELVGTFCMDKKITQQTCSVQIGILRERQHCATCGNAMGEPCTCTDCDCLYCREYKDK